MSHRNARGQQVPDHLWKLAHRVRKHVAAEHVLKHWQSEILDWCQQHAGKPGGGAASGDDGQAVRYADQYVPLPPELNEVEKYAVLGAVHDLVFQAPLGPNAPGHPDELAVPYIVLRLATEQVSEEDATRLWDILAELERVWQCVHSDDFSNIIWFGREWMFSRNQAACIKLLWENWERGTPETYGDNLVRAAGIGQMKPKPLSEVFRKDGKAHPAWGVVVVPGSWKGSFRLAPPPRPPQQQSRKTRRKLRGSSRTNPSFA